MTREPSAKRTANGEHRWRRGHAGALSALVVVAILTASTLPGTAQATFPGANSRLVCVGAKDRAAERDDTELYAINPDGSGLTFLTDNGPLFDPTDTSPTAQLVNEDFPAVSPDSKKIAFESYRSGTSEIWSMKADGSGAQRLTTAVGADTPGSYSPDGRQIVFDSERVTQPGRFDVYKMNADGSQQTRLTFTERHDSSPDWSPDGTRIAFHSDRDAVPGRLNFEIYTMDTNGGHLKRLTYYDSPPGATFPLNLIGFDFLPRWSPDSKKIVWRSYRDGNSELYTMNAADGGDVKRLTNDPGVDDEPAFSPDGTKIVFTSNRSGDNEIYTMNAADGSNVTRLTTNPKLDTRCDWSRIPPPPGAPVSPAAPPGYPRPVAAFAGCPSLTANVIRGTAASNSIVGTTRADRIFASTGDDTVDALAGDDCVDLGPGADRGHGGPGNDLILGGLGRDRAVGGAGNDRINGNSGNDSLKGSSGRDRINGNSGNDLLAGGSGRDKIAGGSGRDKIAGGSGRDKIAGGSGRDTLSGGSGDDRLTARDGKRDKISCGRGRDTVSADRIDRVARSCERILRRR